MIPDRAFDALKALCDAATPGPWHYDGMHPEITTPQGETYWLILSECRMAPDQKNAPVDQFGHYADPNFRFIAQARTALPALIEFAEAMIQCVPASHHPYECPMAHGYNIGCKCDKQFMDEAVAKLAAALGAAQ